MNIFDKLIRFFVMVLVLVSVSAGTQGDKSFEDAASAYCDLYNPARWEDEKTTDVYSIYHSIVCRQASAVANAQLMAIVEAADSSDFVSYHKSISEGISNVLGAKWQCDHFDQFYVPSQTLVKLSLEGFETKRIDPNAANTILITVLNDKNILLGSTPLASSERKTIFAAIKSRLDGKPADDFQFVLYFDEGSSGVLLPDVLSALVELGVKNASLIDF